MVIGYYIISETCIVVSDHIIIDLPDIVEMWDHPVFYLPIPVLVSWQTRKHACKRKGNLW